MGNKTGVRHGYRQESMDDTLEKAKAECVFTDRLYEILLAYQTGQGVGGRRPKGIPPGNVGELSPEMSLLYNLIWSAAVGLNEKSKSKKKQQEVIAA